MNILALDVATVTGWAWGSERSKPVAGIWRMPGMDKDNRARSIAGLYSSVMVTVRENKIDAVCIEAPGAGRNSAHTQLSLTMAIGAAQAGAINGGAKVLAMPQPQSWRKQVLGKGILKNPKQAAMEYCTMHGWGVSDHNAAEAICIWQWAHGQTSLFARIKEG